MKKRGMILLGAALVSAQGLALLVYMQVSAQRERAQREEVAAASGLRRPPRAESRTIQSFVLTMQDGSERDLARLGEPTLVHFWATWCPPCKAELPALIAWSLTSPVPILIVSLDAPDVALGAWTQGARPETLARAEASRINEVFHTSTLPVTFLIQPGGHITARAQGARDWQDSAFQQAWQALLPSSSP